MSSILCFIIGVFLCVAAFFWVAFEIMLAAVVIVFCATWMFAEFVLDEIYQLRRKVKCCRFARR